MNRLIAIVGPTAVGKTKAGIDLAKHLGSDIISGDSMLVYRDCNIGTAKPTIAERQGVQHHLVDILDADQEYTVVDFQQQASALIDTMNKNGQIPIIVGGTGLYLRALLEGYRFHTATINEQLRQELRRLAVQHGSLHLHAMLCDISPERAAAIHPNDLKRIIRSLEIYLSPKTPSLDEPEYSTGNVIFDALVIGLRCNRSLLYDKINQRVHLMIQAGLLDEVRHLVNRGCSIDHQAMQGIGYKEVIEHIQGKVDLETAIENIKMATRRFAKRQLTWFRKMPYIHWIDTDNFASHDKMMAYIYSLMAGKFLTR